MSVVINEKVICKNNMYFNNKGDENLVLNNIDITFSYSNNVPYSFQTLLLMSNKMKYFYNDIIIVIENEYDVVLNNYIYHFKVYYENFLVITSSHETYENLTYEYGNVVYSIKSLNRHINEINGCLFM